NNYCINIWKKIEVRHTNGQKMAKTKDFGYNCLSKSNSTRLLQYHSPHIDKYQKSTPWHDKAHRHEFIGKTQKIDIYSTDHRPKNERYKRYYWDDGPVRLNFLDHENWPHVHEFLREVSELPDAG
ncbi:MAG: hypothetical protein OXB88_01070, partial [Bacteriovoracales bacterium]|nr:hypothetical protein [Bacteriovoracales bacterium]